MPNHNNFPDPILSDIQNRPLRVSQNDERLLNIGTMTVLFGTTDNDVVEVYLYDSNNSISSHLNFYANDSSLTLESQINSNNIVQLLDLNLPVMASAMNVQPGRYDIVLNFFRNEVGSEEGDQLYISEISPSRTELRLKPVDITDTIFEQLNRFVIPTVPVLDANGLIDQVLGNTSDQTENESIAWSNVRSELGLDNRLQYSNTENEVNNFFSTLLSLVNNIALDNLANGISTNGNTEVEDTELRTYIFDALDKSISALQTQGLLDNRIQLV